MVYEQIWPERWGRRRRSRVEQRFVPPDLIRFDFVSGLYRGVVVETRLEPRADGTLVDETYGIPRLPDWRFLRRLARPSVVRRVERIWQEDIDVEVCHGGWPGLPASLEAAESAGRAPEGDAKARDWRDVCPASEVPEDRGLRVEDRGRQVAIFRHGGELFALEGRCPHSGGPLALGSCRDGVRRLPWHGAAFELATGCHIAGPTSRDVLSIPLRVRGDRVRARLSALVAGEGTASCRAGAG